MTLVRTRIGVKAPTVRAAIVNALTGAVETSARSMLDSKRHMRGPKTATEAPPPDSACEVAASDLQRLDAIHHLLEALRDPLASSKLIEHRVSRIPVLTARVIRFAKRGAP